MSQLNNSQSNSHTHQDIDAVHSHVTDFVNEITYWQLPTHGHELLVVDLEEFKKTVLAINDQEAMAILVSASEAITHKSREIWLGVDWCNRIEGRDTSNPEGRKYIKRNLNVDNPNFLIRQGYSTKIYLDDEVPADMKYGAVIYSSVNELKTVCRRKPNHLLLKNDYIFELVLKMFDNAKKFGRLIKPITTLAEQKQVKLSLLPPTDQRVILFKSLKKIDPNFKDCELETFIQTLNSYRLYGPAFNKPKSPELAEIDIQAAFPTAIIANSNSEAKEFLATNGDAVRQQII